MEPQEENKNSPLNRVQIEGKTFLKVLTNDGSTLYIPDCLSNQVQWQSRQSERSPIKKLPEAPDTQHHVTDNMAATDQNIDENDSEIEKIPSSLDRYFKKIVKTTES